MTSIFCKLAWPVSLSTRLLTTTAIALALTAIAAVLTIALLFRLGLEAAINGELEASAEHLVEGLHFDSAGLPDSVAINYRMQVAYDALKFDAVYRVLDQHGAVLISSDQATQAYVPEGASFEPMQARFKLMRNGQSLHVFTLPFLHEGKQFYVQVMRSERMQKILFDIGSQRAKRIILISALVAMLLFSVVVVATLHRMLKPLRKASTVTAHIQIDNLSTRLPLDGVPNELFPLFEAFNLALQRLDDGYRVQREFLATAAHELKTPLTLIRGQIELEYAERGQDCSSLLRDLDHMARQVHQLLHLAEASERQNYALENVDVNEVATQAVAQLERLAHRLNVRILHTSGADAVFIKADRGALFVMMRNLIENALHHAPSGSPVEIDITLQRAVIRDYGNGISDDAMPLLFKRFWRGSHRRDEGAGLGLSICDEIARIHGWKLQAQNVQPGALFTVEFSPRSTVQA